MKKISEQKRKHLENLVTWGLKTHDGKIQRGDCARNQ